jgi:Tol biopolymer transport system component
VPADGSGGIEPLITNGNVEAPWSFTPDGSRLAYHEMNPSTSFDLWAVPVKGSGNKLIAGNPEVVLDSKAYETYPAISPDGHWIAYASNESLTWEVYVRRFPDDGTKVQVSGGGGRVPLWSSNRHELFYRTDSQRLMVATYSMRGGAFAVESVREWSHKRLAETGVLANYDLSPDGTRILALMAVARPEDQQTENHAMFVLNFFDEVRRKDRKVGGPSMKRRRTVRLYLSTASR